MEDDFGFHNRNVLFRNQQPFTFTSTTRYSLTREVIFRPAIHRDEANCAWSGTIATDLTTNDE